MLFLMSGALSFVLSVFSIVRERVLGGGSKVMVVDRSLVEFFRSGVAEESREAYRGLVADPEGLAACQQLIVRALRAHPAGLTNNELSRITGMRINVVTPRVKELRDMLHRDGHPFVVRAGIRVDPYTNKPNAVWVLGEA